MRKLSFLILVVASAVLFASSAFAQSNGSGTALLSSTVYIVAKAQIKGTQQYKTFVGSGVVVSPDGDVLTVAHILPDLIDSSTYVNVEVYGTVGSKYGYPTQLERTGEENIKDDIAFLKFPSGQNLKAAQIPETIRPEQDSFVTILGFPFDLDVNIFHGRISSLNGPQGDWLTDANVQEGSSGGPVFNAVGELIGIVSGGFQSPGTTQSLGLNLIIPVTKARSVAAGIGWQISGASRKLECQGATVTLSGDQAVFPEPSTVPLDRSSNPSDIGGILAASYPFVILDHATVRLPDKSLNSYRFCKLELRNGSKIIVGSNPLHLMADYLIVSNSTIVGIDPVPALSDPDAANSIDQVGASGKPGISSGSVMLAVVLKLDGVLPIALDGSHGGNGGTGGPGASGANGGPGGGGSDTLFGCRRGPGDGERGLTGRTGAAGGTGGAGGDGGNLQIYRLATTILPLSSISFSGAGGRGGAGGLGGPGGVGGSGGPRGAQTTFCHGGSNGPNGAVGVVGPNGAQGQDGLDGTMQLTNVNEQDIVNSF